MRSNASLDSSPEVARDCGGDFVNYLYLILLISGQSCYNSSATQTKRTSYTENVLLIAVSRTAQLGPLN
jgi:hypothetical protein